MNSSKDVPTIPDKDNEHRKLHFTRIKLALDQLVAVGIPIHIQALNEQNERIKQLKIDGPYLKLRVALCQATKTISLLKDDLYQLEQLNAQVEDKDIDLFYNAIQCPVKEIIETLSNFMSLHPDVSELFPDIAENEVPEIPKLVCHLDKVSEDACTVEEYNSLPIVPLQGQTFRTSKSAFPDWSTLKKELLDVNDLIRKFASLIFTQKESIDTVQNNIESTHENVQEGVRQLKKAHLLKAASFPIVGAVVGGVLLGPVGALVGFKLLGTAACVASGGALGYRAGVKLKQKHEISCDIEMKALTYSSREKSTSNPELSTITDNN